MDQWINGWMYGLIKWSMNWWIDRLSTATPPPSSLTPPATTDFTDSNTFLPRKDIVNAACLCFGSVSAVPLVSSSSSEWRSSSAREEGIAVGKVSDGRGGKRRWGRGGSGQSIDPSIHRSFDRSIHPSIDPSIHQSFNWSIHWLIYPSINQSIHPSIHRSIHRSNHPSIHRSINPSTNPLIHPSINHSIDLSIDRSIHWSTNRSIHPSMHCHSEADEDTSGIADTDPKQKQVALTISFRGRKVLL